MSISKKIKQKLPNGSVLEFDLGADAENVDVRFTQASARENIKTGEKLSMVAGKIAKWFSDLKGHAFLDLVQNATTADTTRAVSAAVAKNIQDQVNAQNTKIAFDSKMLEFGGEVEGHEGGVYLTVPTIANIKSFAFIVGNNNTFAVINETVLAGREASGNIILRSSGTITDSESETLRPWTIDYASNSIRFRCSGWSRMIIIYHGFTDIGIY